MQKIRIRLSAFGYLALSLALLLTACATTERAPQSDLASVSTDGKVKLVFTAAQKLQLEPCGCSMGPLGGVKRYWNVITNYRSKVPGNYLQITGGTTFVPPEYKETALATYRLKAETLVNAYNQLGMNVIAPSVADLLLGADTLSSLAKKSKASWVATNWQYKGKALFPKVVKIPYGTGTLWVVGIARPFTLLPAEVAKDVEVIDPKTAIQTVLAEAQDSRLVVAVTNLSYADNVKLLRETPGLHAVLTAEEKEQHPRPELFGKDKILFRSQDMARVLSMLDMTIPAKADNFFDPVLAPQFRFAITRDEKKLAQAQRKLRTAKGPAKEKLEAEVAKLSGDVATYKQIMTAPNNTSVTYEPTSIYLDRLLDNPNNPMDTLLEGTKEMVRESALKSDSEVY